MELESMYVLWLSLAVASPFQEKTMKENLQDFPLGGGFFLPKGRMSIETEVSSKDILGFRDDKGQIQRYENTNFKYNVASIRYTNGFSKYINMYFVLPVVWQYLNKDYFENSIQTVGLGDVHTGIRFWAYHEKNRNAFLSLDLKSPSGVEWPSGLTGYPNDITGFLTGTGTTNLGVSSQFEFTIKPQKYDMTIDVGYVYKFRSVVGYVIEQEGFGNGRLQPGSEIFLNWLHRIGINEQFQIDIWSNYSYRNSYFYGTSGDGIAWNNRNELMSPTQYADVGCSIIYAPSLMHNWSFSVQHQFWGSDTQLFSILGLEEFAPQPGTTFSLGYEVLW